MFKKLLLLILALSISTSLMAEEVVNVYSARIEKLIRPAFDAFTKETGIRVRVTTAKEAELLERLKAEGRFTEADMLITVDAGNLWLAENAGLLHPVESQTLKANIPASLRAISKQWFGLTIRSRTIVYSTDRVSRSDLSTYADLGNPKWKGRLCLRTSKKVYNKSLVASMIANKGEGPTKQMLQSWMKNRPRIYAKDSGVLKAIAGNKCDVGLVNTYYLGRELRKNPDFPVGLFWANQKDQGVHVNISGAGLTKHGKHKKNAQKLLEFLSSEKAQNLFADNNLEYPVNPAVEASDELKLWWGSKFKMESINISAVGKYQRKAVILMNRVGYK